jgi:hypothetical protein
MSEPQEPVPNSEQDQWPVESPPEETIPEEPTEDEPQQRESGDRGMHRKDR